jgi:hypothetical protein
MNGMKLVDGTTIWEDGSRTSSSGVTMDPPLTWPYPPPGGGTHIVETTAQHPGIAVGEPNPSAPGPVYSPGPPRPTVSPGPDIQPLPTPATGVDVWDRWQKLVQAWACLIAWGGGDLDKLGPAIGDMPFYITNKGKKTAIGWWRGIIDAGYDKATSAADLGKGQGVDANDVRALVEQFNGLSSLARNKGYAGCPPAAPPPGAPSPAADTLATISNARAGLGRAWSGLSPRGKLATGAVGLGALILIVRGVAK